MTKLTLNGIISISIYRKRIVSYLTLSSLSSLISLSSLFWKFLNVIKDDDDDRNDSYSFYIKKLVLNSLLCNKIQNSLGSNEKYHFNNSLGYNNLDNNNDNKELLELVLPRVKILEVKSHVLMKRSTLIKLLDYINEDQLKEIIISRMNTNSCTCFANMFIPRIGYGLKSLILGGVGYTSSMPLSDNQLNQILGFLPTIEHLKLMKLGIYIINIFNYNIF
jgi:hypothetical protein